MLGRARQAQEHFEEQRKIDQDLLRLDPLGVAYLYSLSEAYENLGRVALTLGEKARARTLMKDALQIYSDLGARGAISAEYAHVPSRISTELAAIK